MDLSILIITEMAAVLSKKQCNALDCVFMQPGATVDGAVQSFSPIVSRLGATE